MTYHHRQDGSFDIDFIHPMEYSLSGTSVDPMQQPIFPHNYGSSFPGQLDFSMLYSSSVDSSFPPPSPAASEPVDDYPQMPMDLPYLDSPSPLEPYEPYRPSLSVPIPRSHGGMDGGQMFSFSPADQSPTFPSAVPVPAPRRRQQLDK